MACFDKIKSLAKRKDYPIKDIAKNFGMSYVNFSNKFRGCQTRFNFEDLIRYTDMLGFKVAIVDQNDELIETFDINDLKCRER